MGKWGQPKNTAVACCLSLAFLICCFCVYGDLLVTEYVMCCLLLHLILMSDDGAVLFLLLLLLVSIVAIFISIAVVIFIVIAIAIAILAATFGGAASDDGDFILGEA
jgi:hypothetical protein